MPKLYANAIYVVLNSRIRILGGRDTYMSSTDMVISTGSAMIRDTNSYLPQGSPGTDGRRASVVAISKGVLNGDCEMGRMNVSLYGSGALLELIFLQGQTSGQEHGIFRVAVRVHLLNKRHV